MFIALSAGATIEIILIFAFCTFRGQIKQIIISGGITVLAALIMSFFSDVAGAMILMVWGALLFGFELIRSLTGKRINRFVPHILSIVLTVIYFTHAFIVAHGLVTTRYELDLGSDLRIAQISDTHMDSFFDTDDLRKCVEMINRNEPDVVVITGDLVDENTTLSDMKETCKILSELKSTYGTFYVPGNHDGHWGENNGVKDAYRKLEQEMAANDITVLADKACAIGDDYILLGRYDEWFSNSSHTKRIPIKKILERSDLLHTDRKLIVLDHRPINLDSLADFKDVKVSLVLSGHTHGGQIFPVTLVYKIFTGKNDNIYGMKKIKDMYSITSSGASSGQAPFKNTVPNEVVIIDIK